MTADVELPPNPSSRWAVFISHLFECASPSSTRDFAGGFHDGANVHIRQFVTHAVALGHKIWMDRGGVHPQATALTRMGPGDSWHAVGAFVRYNC